MEKSKVVITYKKKWSLKIDDETISLLKNGGYHKTLLYAF